jgi:hypothetical protein
MRWTEGHVHLVMRRLLKQKGWTLVAGEFPGGSDHELYPLNVVDPALARDDSPDPRRHSLGELIPDLVAIQGTDLLIGEAKIRYNERDREKLAMLLSDRKADLLAALRTFAGERAVPELLPVERLMLHPVLIFRANSKAPPPACGFSHLRVVSNTEAFFEGALYGRSL